MRPFHIILCLAFAAALVWFSLTLQPEAAVKYGGLTAVGWAGVWVSGLFLGFVALLAGARRRSAKAADGASIRTLTESELHELGLDRYRGPKYPHPVIFPDRCIGCQACVDACPHDVLDIVDGRAAAVAPDLCMEDTACQAECPVNPKACIVINTSREVRSLPTPTRDGATYQTNVPGCYIIGDVSGVPLIKNAVKEGAEVISVVAAELASAAPEPKADLDVAIIGIGPAGASAAVSARDAGLRYVAIEQDRVLSTIDLYPKGKYIFFKPDTKDWSGGISTVGLGLTKAKYGAAGANTSDVIISEIGTDLSSLVKPEAQRIHDALIIKVPSAMQAETSPLLLAKAEK